MATILLIDDDPAVLTTLTRVLERAGHTVEAAENGLVGMKHMESAPAQIVVTDLLMPEQEGIETIMELKERFPKVGVIAISGAGGGEGDPLKDAALFGADHTLSKPFSMADLLAAVDSILSRD